MDLATFHQMFPNEQSCIDYFKNQRLASGLKCSSCGKQDFKFANGKRRFYCKSCNKSISLKSGTVMEQSNLSFKNWLFCIKYMTMTKKGVSAKEMQRLLGLKRYEPVWYMMHKLRAVMGKRDDMYQLNESIEIDEGFFERVSEKKNEDNDEHQDIHNKTR